MGPGLRREHANDMQRPRRARVTPRQQLDHDYRQELVGRRLEVYWAADALWFSGTVKDFDRVSGWHTVSYDDGDQRTEPLNSADLVWRLLKPHDTVHNISTGAAYARAAHTAQGAHHERHIQSKRPGASTTTVSKEYSVPVDGAASSARAHGAPVTAVGPMAKNCMHEVSGMSRDTDVMMAPQGNAGMGSSESVWHRAVSIDDPLRSR